MDVGQYEDFTEDEFTEDEQDAKVEFDGGYGMQGFSPKDIALKVKAEQEVARVMANSGVFAMEDEEDLKLRDFIQSELMQKVELGFHIYTSKGKTGIEAMELVASDMRKLLDEAEKTSSQPMIAAVKKTVKSLDIALLAMRDADRIYN